MRPNLTTHYLGLTLNNPVVASSSPLTGDLDALERLAEAGVAAAVLPSLFEEQIVQMPSSPAQQTLTGGRFATRLSHVPDVHRNNVGPRDYLKLVEDAKRRLTIPVVGSLNGCSEGGWIRYAREIQNAGADALELNIYIVPTSPAITAAQIETQYVDLVQAVRDATTIPLAVKIGAQFSSLPNFATQLANAGANGLVLFNRYLEPDIDLRALQFRPELSLSSNHEMRLPLRWIGILRDKLSISLAASGGVQSAKDVIKLLLTGADAVMMTSTLLRAGTDTIVDFLDDLERWMEANGFGSVEQLKGSLSYGYCADSGDIERAYYMRAIASYSAVH